MNVYAVVSEMLHTVSYEPPDEEWGCIALIVAAETRGQARYLAMKSDPGTRSYGPVDWPKLWTKKLGVDGLPAGVVGHPDDFRWWLEVGDWNPGVDAELVEA